MVHVGEVAHGDEVALQHLTGCDPSVRIKLKHRLQHVHKHVAIGNLCHFIFKVVTADGSGLKHKHVLGQLQY